MLSQASAWRSSARPVGHRVLRTPTPQLCAQLVVIEDHGDGGTVLRTGPGIGVAQGARISRAERADGFDQHMPHLELPDRHLPSIPCLECYVLTSHGGDTFTTLTGRDPLREPPVRDRAFMDQSAQLVEN
jgi:hypothetical protein